MNNIVVIVPIKKDTQLRVLFLIFNFFSFIVLPCKNFFSPFLAPRFREDMFHEDEFNEDKFCKFCSLKTAKSEIRNNLKITNSNVPNLVSNFSHLILEFVSDFNIWISNLSKKTNDSFIIQRRVTLFGCGYAAPGYLISFYLVMILSPHQPARMSLPLARTYRNHGQRLLRYVL